MNIIYSLDSVQMILNLQSAHKMLKTQYKHFRNLKYWNWFYVFGVFVAYTIMILLFMVGDGKLDIIEIFYLASIVHYENVVLEANRMIALINNVM